jgi:hypothetical protein
MQDHIQRKCTAPAKALRAFLDSLTPEKARWERIYRTPKGDDIIEPVVNALRRMVTLQDNMADHVNAWECASTGRTPQAVAEADPGI